MDARIGGYGEGHLHLNLMDHWRKATSIFDEVSESLNQCELFKRQGR